MSKKVILGLALALVLVSGSIFSAQAICGFGFGGCLPRLSMPSACLACPPRDVDRGGPPPGALAPEIAPFTDNFADPSQPLSPGMYERDRDLSWG